MLEAIWVFSYLYFVDYERVCDDVRDSEPMDEKPRVCASGWTVTSSSPRSALCGGLGVCPEPKRCYEKINDDRATYKEGVRATYKCAEGPPGSKWNVAGDLPRNPRRANAKELRRAYDRARQELRTLEREARPKERKTD